MTTLEIKAGDLTRSASHSSALSRWIVLVYGVICYVMFLGVFLYAIGFIGDFLTPTSLNKGTIVATPIALAINLSLLAAFGLQHSVMARPTFKAWWCKFVPKSAERSTYVLASNLCLIALFILWQPMPSIVWEVQSPLARSMIYGLFAFGWVLVLITTFLINHFDLFGLRQVWLHWQGREYTHLGFVTPLYYKIIRHPLYVGWICAFWAMPTMTWGHLTFAVGTTAYILVAIYFEERNLIEHHGDTYLHYRKRTGALLPKITSAA